MIERIFLYFASLAVFVVAISYDSCLNSNEAEAKIFLNQSSSKIIDFHFEMSKSYFNSDNKYDAFEVNRNSTIFLNKIVEDARKFDFKNFEDEQLKYAFEILVKIADQKIIGEERYMDLFYSLVDLEILFKEQIIEHYNSRSILLAYSPDVERRFEISNNPQELGYYWLAWNHITGKWAEKNLNTRIKAIKDAAYLTELSPLEFWMRGFNITDMENLMHEFRPLYLELHAFIRSLLQEKYGDSIFASGDGLIPDHLFHQVTHQSWSYEDNNSIIEKIFPYESLPPLEEKFNRKQAFEIAEQFLVDLGFQKYPSSFWRDRKRMSESEDDDCGTKTRVLVPNIDPESCKKLHYLNFLAAYERMTFIYSSREMVGLPAYFHNSPNGLIDAIISAVILSSSTHHNLKAIGMISDDFNITQDVEMNRLLRMAIRQLLYIATNFVTVKCMSDLLLGNVRLAAVNSHYWHLMDKYAGVGPPKGHKPHTYDLPDFFLRGMDNNKMSIDFTEEILSYQIHKKLCELSEKYPAQPLHLCNISGSRNAGNALRKMMSLGSSKPFYEVLATMFPENPTVRIEALLEYYNPIKNLLVKKNKEANVKPGWKNSDFNKNRRLKWHSDGYSV